MQFYGMRYGASLFTPELNIGRTSTFIDLFRAAAGEILDGDVLSLPVPQDAPPSIPRVVLKSASNEWTAQVSLERTDIFFHRQGNLEVQIPKSDKFVEVAIRIFESFLNGIGTRIQRLSYVSEMVIDVGDVIPAKWIAERYCKDEYTTTSFKKAKLFEIHSLKKYPCDPLGGENVNSWVRIKPFESNRYKNNLVHVINDFNTYSMEEKPNNSFNLNNIISFFEHAPHEIWSIHNLYFDFGE